MGQGNRYVKLRGAPGIGEVAEVGGKLGLVVPAGG